METSFFYIDLNTTFTIFEDKLSIVVKKDTYVFENVSKVIIEHNSDIKKMKIQLRDEYRESVVFYTNTDMHLVELDNLEKIINNAIVSSLRLIAPIHIKWDDKKREYIRQFVSSKFISPLFISPKELSTTTHPSEELIDPPPHFISTTEITKTTHPSEELIDHPPHYDFGKIEPIKVIEDWDLSFNLGNCVKYIARHDKKGDLIKDLKKAKWYLTREIEKWENLEKEM